MAKSFFKHQVKKINGTQTNLGEYEGRVLLVVNVASKCGLTPQYDALEKLYEKYRGRGFEVLGFPSNEFLGQEPGTNDEIAQFCESKFGVKFPMFEKITVNGSGRNPLYTEMIQAKPARTQNGDGFEKKLAGIGQPLKVASDVLWNFEKFLVDRQGNVVDRFSPDMAPDDPKIIKAIEAQL